jgi:CHAD domain-containing protein
MAKAKEIACVDPRSDQQAWLAEVVQVRFDEVVGYCSPALSTNDIDGIHDMRVATRRLRTVLRDFEEINGKLPLKRTRKDLKKLSDMLGSVRDQDVAVLALEDFLTETETEKIKTGIEALIRETRELRQEAHLDLSKTFSLRSVENLREIFKSATDADIDPDSSRPATIEAAGRKLIGARFDELLELGQNIFDPHDNKALHKLRIAAKRLRYAIELFAACLGGSILPFAKEVAKLQSRLGEVHDCDVWIADLSKRLKDSENEPSFEAEAWLLSEFVRKRSKEYRSALELWSEWKTNDFTARLNAAISTGVTSVD